MNKFIENPFSKFIEAALFYFFGINYQTYITLQISAYIHILCIFCVLMDRHKRAQ